MPDSLLTNLIIILLSIATGMIIGTIFKPKDKYHGPNAKSECQKKYYSKKKKACIKFGIQPMECPKPKKNYRRIWEHFTK